MKHLIRKILKEDLGWVDDIPTFEIPDDYDSENYTIYKDDYNCGYMGSYDFLDANDLAFDCDDYDECPRSEGEVTLYYPNQFGVGESLDFMESLVGLVRSGNGIGESYMWDEDKEIFIDISKLV